MPTNLFLSARGWASAAAFAVLSSGAAHAQEAVTIDTAREGLTMINVMTPAEGDKAEVLARIRQGIREEMATVEGFQRAAIHSSADSSNVTVYAQWDSSEALGRAIVKLEAGEAPNMAEAYRLGNPDPHPYTVEDVIVAR